MILIVLLISLTIFSVSYPQIKIPSNKKSQQIVNRILISLQEELKSTTLGKGSNVYIRIFKETKELELWIKKENLFELFKTYSICNYGYGSLGPKLAEWDGQAPEGFYSINSSSLNPNSDYHLSIGVGYPNRYDRILGRTGSAIMIHGYCCSIGCFAMGDSSIEEIYTIVDTAFRNGQNNLHIDIFPFRMNEENMMKHKESEWIDFWSNLREGYDFFEKNKIPPRVGVGGRRYTFL